MGRQSLTQEPPWFRHLNPVVIGPTAGADRTEAMRSVELLEKEVLPRLRAAGLR